jgi:hypothetical protein
MSSSELSAAAGAASLEEMKWKETREKVIKEHKEAVGKANFEAAKAKPGVGGLSALEKTEQGQKWLHALVPTSDEEGRKLHEELLKCLETPEDDEEFEKVLKKAKEFYKGRNSMYTHVLKHEVHGAEATKQICALAGNLDSTFKEGYNNIFETWIQVGDSVALAEFARWAKDEATKLKENSETMMQSSNDLASCYENACDERLIEKYTTFLKKVANETGGVFTCAPVKCPMRAMEKTAFKYEEKTRWKCENVYDVVRGSISYPTMKGIKLGAEMICNSEEFEALRVTDRLSKDLETSSGWRDGMINGKLKKIKNRHVVEVQLHHDKLVSIREDLGGHYMYSIYRSLVEALEVVYGDEKGKVQKMIADQALELGTGSHNKLAGENEELRATINELNEKARVSDSVVCLCIWTAS